jgi:uncharacterized membrane protein YjjP (DUF1212 family)
MNQDNKEGVSVKEIEAFAKKHRFEVFFCLAFILACFFSFLWGPWWSVIFATIGGIVGVLLSSKLPPLSKSVFSFIFKQEPTVQLVLGIVGLILAIFLPPLYFLLLGLHGGKDLQQWANDLYNQHKPR